MAATEWAFSDILVQLNPQITAAPPISQEVEELPNRAH